MSSQDPFELDKKALDSKLKVLRESLERWRQVKTEAGELTAPEDLEEAENEFNWLREEIVKSVKSIGWDLDDLAETLRRMSEQHRRPTEESATRAEYIRRMRDFLNNVDAEVKKSSTEASAVSELPDDGPTQPPRQQQQDSRMSASTERLVESLLQQDDEDDDVELLIRDEGRRQFSVSTGDQPLSPAMRLWRYHRPAVVFVAIVVILLLIILVVSVASGKHQKAADSWTTLAP